MTAVPQSVAAGCREFQKELHAGKRNEMIDVLKTAKVVAIAAAILSGVIALTFASMAVGSKAAILFLIPAAVLGIIGHEAYRVSNMFDILRQKACDYTGGVIDGLMDEAQWILNKPTWVKSVEAEMNKTLLLHLFVKA